MKLRWFPEQAFIEIIPGVELPIRGEEHVGRMIYQSRYERAEMALLPLVLSPGSIAIDIGANIGFYALQIAALVVTKEKFTHSNRRPSCLSILREAIRKPTCRS